jgi:membrane protein CcdC involved in cytochrome C biogenesis
MVYPYLKNKESAVRFCLWPLMKKLNIKTAVIFLTNILYTNYFVSLSEKSDTSIAIQGLSNFNEDLSDISFPIDVNLNYLQFTIFISIISTLIIRFIILKIDTESNPVNYLKIVGYTFFTNTGVLLTVFYLFRFFNFPRKVLFLQIVLYPLIFGTLVIILNIYLKENSKIFKNSKFINLSILLTTLILGYFVFQQFDDSRISAQRTTSELNENVEAVTSLEIEIRSVDNNTECFKWSGSNNYKECIGGIKLKLISEFKQSKINNIVIHKNKRYIITSQGIIYNEDNSVFLDISERVTSDASEAGLYDLAFHPEKDIFIISYANFENSLVVEEFSLNNETPFLDGKIIKEIPNPTKVHYCGALEWSTYFNSFLMCVGDMGINTDPIDTSSQRGKIILLGSDYLTYPDQLTESLNLEPINNILAYGLRNPWNFIQVENLLIVPDVGEKSNEELNIINLEDFELSGNKPYLFGWPLYEGSLLSEKEEFGIKNWSRPEIRIRDFIMEKAIPPVVYYDRPAPENNRAAIIGTVFIENPSSPFDKNILFADYLSKELFAYDYLSDEISIISLPPFPGFLTAISKHPSDNNKILIATVDSVLTKLYEVTLPQG